MNLARDKSKPTRRLRSGGSTLFILLFGLFWCSIVTVFDFVIIGPFLKQVRSASFQSAPARITKASQVSSYSSGKHRTRTFGVEFEYEYTVGGTNYPGRLYTFDTSKSSDRRWVEDALREFPAGTERVAYYDPENPAVAILQRGISGADITRLMFITPFNLIGLGLLAYPISSWRQSRRLGLTPRVLDHRHHREAYSMNSFGPFLTFFGVFFLTTFLGIFVVVFSSGFHPTMSFVVTVWSAGVAISIATATNVYLKTKAGKYDLVIDRNSNTVKVPAMHKRKQHDLIPIADVATIDTEEIEFGNNRRGGKNRRWHVNLHTRDQRKLHLNTFYNAMEADRIARSLSDKILQN
jgi:hypothetical protein